MNKRHSDHMCDARAYFNRAKGYARIAQGDAQLRVECAEAGDTQEAAFAARSQRYFQARAHSALRAALTCVQRAKLGSHC